MADLLGNPQVVNGLRWVFDKCDFGCKQIGLSCNAYRPRIFTKAECDARPILCGRGNGGVSIDFVNLFETGFRIISQLKLGKLKYEEIEGHFKKAFEILDKFMVNKNIHEKSLKTLLKNGNKLTEAVVITALAEHLLVNLAPEQSCTIDKRYQDKSENQVCKCGCGAELKFGNTGIGHEEVWHGFVDIMFSSHETAVVADIVNKKPKEAWDQKENELSINKSETSVSDLSEDSPEIRQWFEDKTDSDDQTIAQAIVFSMLQKQRHPELNNFLIPTIVISATKFRIIMYDAENDILLQSNSYDLFVNEESTAKLSTSSIVILWMVLHYRIFCSGVNKVNLYEDLDKVKSGFIDRLPPECVDIYKYKLKSCVPSFPIVERKTMENLGQNPLCNKPQEFWI